MMGVRFWSTQVHSGEVIRSVSGKRAAGRKRAALTVGAISVALLMTGCVCRPLHVSESDKSPATIAALKASLP
jgi:hypothetical protein